MKGKDEAAALVAALQSTSDSEARASACESVLLLTKADATCAVLCSVGGIHAVVSLTLALGQAQPLALPLSLRPSPAHTPPCCSRRRAAPRHHLVQGVAEPLPESTLLIA